MKLERTKAKCGGFGVCGMALEWKGGGVFIASNEEVTSRYFPKA